MSLRLYVVGVLFSILVVDCGMYIYFRFIGSLCVISEWVRSYIMCERVYMSIYVFEIIWFLMSASNVQIFTLYMHYNLCFPLSVSYKFCRSFCPSLISHLNSQSHSPAYRRSSLNSRNHFTVAQKQSKPLSVSIFRWYSFILVCMIRRIRAHCPIRWTTFRRMCLVRMASWRGLPCRCLMAAKTPGTNA